MAKKTTTVEREHALLSASSAKKWLHCTPSARLEDTIPDERSEYAAEGTLAHSLCELNLCKRFTDKNMTERTFKGRLNKLMKEPHYAKEMDGFTDSYVDYITDIAYGFPSMPFMAVEKRVDYSEWAPEGFGTCDCVMVYGDQMHICDFKYGKGVPVSAYENDQLRLYALGAWNELRMIFPIKRVVLHIIQPRTGNPSSWETSIEELLQWGRQVVKPAAQKAFKGEGECVQGEWCDSGFCRLRATCRKRAEENHKLMGEAVNRDPNVSSVMKLPPQISNEEVGRILKDAQFLASWVKKLEAYAQGELLAGREIPGWKLVEGRSTRTISDVDAAFRALQAAGYPEAVLYEKKPYPLTELEKNIEKEHREILSQYITKPQGKPTLAPADDKRPAMQFGTTAEEAFGGANTYKEVR